MYNPTMLKRFRLCVLALALPALSACVVADGIAHVVKLSQDSDQKGKSANESPPPDATPPRGQEPPPPVVAPSAASAPVSVETLAPPAR